MSAPITDATDAFAFVTGGRAVFTLKSAKTGTHYTYKVSRKDETTPFFVGVLSGPDNGSDYQYIGFITTDDLYLRAGRKGKPDAPSFKALAWTLRHLVERDAIPEQLEFWHEGRCCRCARKLTHPHSIETGIGPECAKKGG